MQLSQTECLVLLGSSSPVLVLLSTVQFYKFRMKIKPDYKMEKLQNTFLGLPAVFHSKSGESVTRGWNLSEKAEGFLNR